METGTLAEALAWIEYCNSRGRTYWADRRRENGHGEPYQVRYWALGNERYGDWQVGAMSARSTCARPLAPAAAHGGSAAAPAMGTLGQAYNGVARLDPRCGVRPGDRVRFRVDPGRLYFFAPDSGAALARPEEEAAVAAH
ncbi:MAG TPA: hypothetical protein VK817_25830 [Trebonia sp.]|jgi:hypothetical protein|nr:hypothetical protein [Trebonia sp.]